MGGRKQGRKWRGDIPHKFETVEDPYLPKKAPAGEALCPRCHAVFRDKRWFFDEDFYNEFKESDLVPQILCPGCRKSLDRYAMGYVTLAGGFFEKHKEEIMKVIMNEYKRAREKNPLMQIISVTEEDGKIIIETTSERLAQRLGRAVYKAYKGDLEFRWAHQDKFVRVYWNREA
ncbi:BCAM0308 family protein [Thermosulfuriphilus sp.]